LVFGHDALVAAWVRSRLEAAPLDGPVVAIGVASGDDIVAGVVYSQYVVTDSVEMTVAAAAGQPWLNRRFLHTFFAYPFVQLGVRRVVSLIRDGNAPSRRLVEGLGFQLEGRLREGWSEDEDLLVYGLLKRECRWLRTDRFGQEDTRTAAAA
jgi:RimJ/RimL family protein N-acetyltransferase